MPRYFFDIHDGTFVRDTEGVDLQDANAAYKQVWSTLPKMAAERKTTDLMACQLRMDVRDESGKDIFHAALAFVIEPASSE